MLPGMHLGTVLFDYAPLLLRCACCLLLGLVVYGYHPIQRWRYRELPGGSSLQAGTQRCTP
jgi:hypothetical protein